MIKRIQIENYKSFGKVDIEPHPRVNLLIGPNSSGKSNFLEALQFGRISRPIVGEIESHFKELIGQINRNTNVNSSGISIEFLRRDLLNNQFDYQFFVGPKSLRINIQQLASTQDSRGPGQVVNRLEVDWRADQRTSISNVLVGSDWNYENLDSLISGTFQSGGKIGFYRPNPSSIRKDILSQKFQNLSEDLGNLPLLIRHLDDYHRDGLFQQFRKTLKELTNEFDRVAAPPSSSPGHIELCFFSNDVAYSLHEVSEGILLFSALLAILHLPEPPQVILLEEPENGIHPRRLAEIVSLIRRLAEEKEVQFFITTHSPIILDQFQDAPECVLVFDKVDGVSKVRNLKKDILDPREETLRKNGISNPSNLTDDLGANWMAGLIDGVPASNFPEGF